MRRINETDIRQAGLVPAGHPTYRTAKQLLERLSQRHETIAIDYEHCINCHKRQWQWKYYQFVGLENNNCLVREICAKPLTEEQKELLKQKLQNNEDIDFSEFQKETYLSEQITKFDLVDLVKRHDAFQANIKV